ncbi:hypothetical protein JTB14_007731 [Gonioctena quinquepunctata]|nr:hypothetical protein JTB14_007731 [Gonioctena quinquepunctata]
MAHLCESFGLEGDDLCLFAKLVECRPWLYDMENSNYKNNNFKDETWRLVAEAMGWEDDECGMTAVIKCKTTWKRLRDNFMRAFRKLPPGAKAADIEIMRKKPIYNALMFLRKTKEKNTRKTSSNFKLSESQNKKFKLSSPLLPKEQWSDSIIIEENPIGQTDEEIGGSEQLENNADGNGEGVYESLSCQDPRSGPSKSNIDQITKKKSAKFNKFEEMLAKGFETFNSFVKPPAARKTKTPNETFCDYLLTELEEIPKEHQSTVRRKLIIHLHTLKEEL